MQNKTKQKENLQTFPVHQEKFRKGLVSRRICFKFLAPLAFFFEAKNGIVVKLGKKKETNLAENVAMADFRKTLPRPSMSTVCRRELKKGDFC